jgi:hypothetical protein
MGDTIPWGDPRSIWPGPECKSVARRDHLRDFMPWDPVFVRTRGIALGHVRARERELFARWISELVVLEHDGYRVYATGTAARVRRHPGDPASFVRRCEWSDLRAVAERAGFVLPNIPTQKALRVALLASPEWASLPWQQEPAPRG